MIMCEGKSLVHVPWNSAVNCSPKLSSRSAQTHRFGFQKTVAAPRDKLIAVAKEMGFEGIVAKRKDSCYEIGKGTGAWLKFKLNKSQPFVIGGYTPGNPLDALIVGYYEDSRLLFAGKVRNGFRRMLRREVHQQLKHLQTDHYPFAYLPERKRTPWALTPEEMKNWIWVRPAFVANIEFLEWTVEDQLRHSRFVSLETPGTHWPSFEIWMNNKWLFRNRF